jgi:hypothetical protein
VTSLARPAAPVIIEAIGETAWRERSSLGSRRFVLDSGTLRLAIARSPGDQPVVVEVPDGELEDEGTTFSVSVAAGRTVSIRVEAGAVVFRQKTGTLLRVPAGESWTDARARATSPPAPPSAPSAEPIVRDPPAPVAPTRAKRAARVTKDAADPGSRGTLEAEEDLQYLRIVALGQEGRDGEAALAAKDYLRHFPLGFRRVEVEEIAGKR